MDRTRSETTGAGTPSAKTTQFAYLGLTTQVLDESVAGQITKSYQYSPFGQRLSQVVHNTDGTTEDGYYGYNAHTDVEDLTTAAGDTKTTYAYTAYGSDGTTGFSGIDAPDPQNPGADPYNTYRFNGKRFDSATSTYDMGFRDYNPGLNQFLTRDNYNGALADMGLITDPYTGNRYAYGAGNPYNNIELDGHLICQKPDRYDCGKAPDYNHNSGKYEPTLYQDAGLATPDTSTTSTTYNKTTPGEATTVRNMQLAKKLAAYTNIICSLYDKLACDLWRRYGDVSGKDFIVDPGELANDSDFAERIEKTKSELIDSALKECHAESGGICRYKLDRLWQDGNFVKNDSLHNGIGHFKYRLESSLTVTMNQDRPVVEGSYKLSVYNRWNFDREDKAHGISLRPFSEMPAAGIARPFDMLGTSDEIYFSTLPR